MTVTEFRSALHSESPGWFFLPQVTVVELPRWYTVEWRDRAGKLRAVTFDALTQQTAREAALLIKQTTAIV